MVDKTSRIAVIGAGLNGMPTALKFAQMGFAVDVYERKQNAAQQGGSHRGDTRAIRLSLPEGLQYTRAVNEIRPLYAEIAQAAQALTGKAYCLTRDTGFLVVQKLLGANTANSGVHGTDDYIVKAVAMAQAASVPYSDNTAELVDRFPQFFNQEDTVRFYGENDGVLFVSPVLEAQWVVAANAGAQFFFNTIVSSVTNTLTGAIVSSSRGDVEYDAVVVAPGSWLPDFVPPDIAATVEIHPQTQYFIEMDQPELYTDVGKKFPGFICMDSARNFFYGFPAFHDAENLGIVRYMKVAGEQFNPKFILKKPEDMPTFPIPLKSEKDPRAFIETVAGHYLGGLGKRKAKVVSWINCPYTKNTKGFDFTMYHRGHVLYMLACGGQAAKLGLKNGSEAAQSVVNGKLTPWWEQFSEERIASSCVSSSPPPAPPSEKPLPPNFSREPGVIVSGSQRASPLSRAIPTLI